MGAGRDVNSTRAESGPELAEDAIWVLSSTIIIFTMQSGESEPLIMYHVCQIKQRNPTVLTS